MNQVENVGSMSSGITAMGWSPDHEMLVLTTGEGKMVMMTREFDVLSEDHLSPASFGETAFVNVGWGKKETQFHGSEGKEAAQTKAQVSKHQRMTLL
jgi:elongator complex protein 1